MKNTKIEWCDATWNPITGCLHGCTYCYAKKIAERFGGLTPSGYGKTQVLDTLNHRTDGKPDVYPYGFLPTFHRYKLDEPQHWKVTRTIFVCSMADLFGEWVPDEWIQEVFAACEKAPQHQYLFLTKNPRRYSELRANGIQPPANSIIGTSATTSAEAIERTRALSECWNVLAKWFVSVEPILEKMSCEAMKDLSAMDWIIIGAETGNRKSKVIPQKEWIDEICKEADIAHTPVFMKKSLLPIMGEENMRREFPWGTKKAEP